MKFLSCCAAAAFVFSAAAAEANLLDLEESAQPLIPVPVRTRDRVVLIQRGSRIPNEIPAMRVLNTDHPDTWLSASQSLPESLRGVE